MADETRTSRKTGRPPVGAAVLQEDVTAAIKDAVFDELARTGYGRLSIEAVAKRAGVGKTAVYRRWPDKQAMVVAVLSEVAITAIDVPDTRSLRSDVRAYLVNAGAALEHPLASKIIPDLLAETARNSDLGIALMTSVRDPRREKAALLLRRAVERGELPADHDLELNLDFLAGPLYWRLTVLRSPRDDSYFDRLTDKIVAAMTEAGS
jgi:AcrR family transcriptional regulator